MVKPKKNSLLFKNCLSLNTNYKLHFMSKTDEIPANVPTNLFGEIFTLLKNKKLLLFFSIATILVIITTSIITSAVIKSRSNLDFVAIINEDLEYMLEHQRMKSWSTYAIIDAKSAELPYKYENLQKQREQSRNQLIFY
jgi:hypothetical protein